MNKLSKLVLGVAVSAMVLSGCRNQEVVAPTVTNPNQFPNGVIAKKITFSVHVVASSQNGRTEGLSGASVTVSQNGNLQTKTVGVDGAAIFTDMYEGGVTYYVTASGFAAVNATRTLSASNTTAIAGQANTGTSGNNSNQTIITGDQVVVTLPKLDGSLTGIFTIDNDGLPTTAKANASGYQVRIKYPSTYQPNLFTATTDGSGVFTLNGILDGVQGDVSVDAVLSIDGTPKKVAYTNTFTAKSGTLVSLGSNELTVTNGTSVKTTGAVKGQFYGNFNLANGTANIAFNTSGFTGQQSGTSVIFYLETVSLTVANPNAATIRNVTTDAQGIYSITGLAAGTYKLVAKAVLANNGTSGPLNYQGTTNFDYTSPDFTITDDVILDRSTVNIRPSNL